VFNKAIHSTTLTTETAERLFSNIAASNVPDISFLATLRALLRKRLPHGETVKLTVRPLHMLRSEIEVSSVQSCMSAFIPDGVKYPAPSCHSILIICTAYPDAGEKMLEIVRANAGVGKRYMSGYTLREDLRVFYARKLKALFFTDDTGRNTVIFTDKLELKDFHALQMMVSKYLPLLFADDPLTEMETILLKSTGNKSAVEYETLIEDFAKDLDIRAEIIRAKLFGFETAFERTRLDEIRSEITHCQNEYDSYISILQDLASKMQERKYTLAGLECSINEHSEDSELMEYFMCNKNLTIINVVGPALEFVVHGYADMYDQDAFDKYVINHNGYMYYLLNSAVTKPQMEKLYRSIFGDGRYRLRLCAAYTADMRSSLKACAHYCFPPESNTYFPNPHIQQFGCIGSYAGRFQEYMRKRDYVGAIDQAIVSARNLNFYDSSVIGRFAHDLSCSGIKCIEKSDGSLLTPLEAIKELNGGAVCQDQS